MINTIVALTTAVEEVRQGQRTPSEVLAGLTPAERQFWADLAPMILDPTQLEYLYSTVSCSGGCWEDN